MRNPAREAGDAARLVGFALKPKVAQGSDPDYAALCGLYRTDDGFREVVERVADGLGLVVLDHTEQGLIVAPADAASPFAFRLSDYARGLDLRRRVLVGLVHLGVAAVCYPREADLEVDLVVRRSVAQVEALLRQACDAFADAAADDPAVGEDGDVALAWREYRATPSSRLRRDGGLTADCTLGVITNAFEWLVAQGFARTTATAGTYQVLDRYRVQVRELAGHEALERLRALVPEAPEGVAC